MKKRLLSLMFVLALVLQLMPSAFVSAKILTATAELGEKANLTGFDKVIMGQSETPKTAVKDEQTAWLLDKSVAAADRVINFKFKEDFAHQISDGSEFDIEVEYFDEGKGYFVFMYDQKNNARKQGHIQYLANERMWKTAKFTVDDAYFGKRLNEEYDFQIAISVLESRSNTVSSSSVAIKEVKITRREGINPLWITAKTDEGGNAFEWYSEEKIYHNLCENTTEKPIEAEIDFYAVTEQGIKLFEETRSIKLEPGESQNIDIDFGDKEYCDMFSYYARVRFSDGKVSHRKLSEFAIVKTDPNGIKNDKLYARISSMNTNVNGDVHGAAAETMAKANFGGASVPLFWWAYETKPAYYRLNNPSNNVKSVIDALKQYGMKFSPVWAYMSFAHSTTHIGMPKTQNQITAFQDALTNFMQETEGVLNDIEIYNEVNHSGFNPDLYNEYGNPAGYVKYVLKPAYETIKKVNPEIKVVGLSQAGINPEFVEEGIAGGLVDWCDAIAVHPYERDFVEKGVTFERFDKIRKMLDDAGGEHIEIFNTEVGYSAADPATNDWYKMGDATVRMIMQYSAREYAEVNMLYCYDRPGSLDTEREDRFGIVEPAPASIRKYDTPYLATPAYLSVAAMNYLMAQTEADGIYDLDENVRILKFKSNKFGKDIVCMYAAYDDTQISIDVGTDNLTYFDKYGNETEMGSDNGRYSFALTSSPVYIMGDFSKCQADENIDIYLSQTNAVAAVDDVVSMVVNKGDDNKAYTLEIDVPDALTAQIGEFADNKADIMLTVTSGNYENLVPTVKVSKDGKVAAILSADITIGSPITPDIKFGIIDLDNLNKWRASITIKNDSAVNAAKGYIIFEEPAFLQKLGKIDIGCIPKQNTGLIELDVPNIREKGQYGIKYNITMANGQRYEFEDMVDFTLAKYAERKPTIDGVLGEDEWDITTAMAADEIGQVKQIGDWNGKNDLSGHCIMMWDEEKLYLAAKVCDNVFYQKNGPNNMWSGDSIQFGIFYGEEGYVAMGQAATTFHEITMGLTPEGPFAYRHLSQDNVYPVGLCTNYELQIKNEGMYTTYEFAIPWSDLLREGERPEAGEEIGFSFLFNDNDGSGRRGWIEYASGIGEAKDATLFTYLRLLK